MENIKLIFTQRKYKMSVSIININLSILDTNMTDITNPKAPVENATVVKDIQIIVVKW